jgi:dTMP kinase
MTIANSKLSTPQSTGHVALTKHNLPGRLIAFCGADGTGKSTAIGLLVQAFKEKGIGDSNLVLLRQPSSWWRDDPLVKKAWFVEGGAEIADELAMGVFAVADRINQQALVIEPALAAGRIVLMDRYVVCLLTYFMTKSDSQAAYLASMCKPLFEPDLTFVFDCPPQVAVDRVVKRDGPRAGRYDQQIGRMTKIMEAYRSVAHSNELHLVSSLEPPGAILTKLLEALQDYGTGTTTSRNSQ